MGIRALRELELTVDGQQHVVLVESDRLYYPSKDGTENACVVFAGLGG